MCQLAVMDEPGLSVCAVEVERGGLSYTVDTLRSIHATHPHAQLTFIVGADTASTLGSWREPAQLLELAQLAVATRDGTARQRVIDALDAAHSTAAAGDTARGSRAGAAKNVRFLAMPAIEVSSSAVRQGAARGEAIDQLVGPAVAAYIAEHGLYRACVEVGR
jgi:nicotinate-nucleotide adenylyltransferase